MHTVQRSVYSQVLRVCVIGIRDPVHGRFMDQIKACLMTSALALVVACVPRQPSAQKVGDKDKEKGLRYF
jgi:hypothetical protein